MTARNLDGRGVRVLVLGDKGKGVAELFDGKNIRYEEWWNKKYMPGLIKTRYVVLLMVYWRSLIPAAATAPFISIHLSLASSASHQLWSPV
jgi:hypothetical protein